MSEHTTPVTTKAPHRRHRPLQNTSWCDEHALSATKLCGAMFWYTGYCSGETGSHWVICATPSWLELAALDAVNVNQVHDALCARVTKRFHDSVLSQPDLEQRTAQASRVKGLVWLYLQQQHDISHLP